ncbi:glycosyltransferase family 2 protein [Aliivibrio fischeri]|uniref:glycosyltransferase family 2 protein n=1 Tax=Aliivibrio fischeri TaxID=668 RepID=UPI0012D97448|nr:glycosyltransferase [Aliivibrio fischeri]MUI52512.1 glycosyltransferase [Aliivibrio fischeri]
MFKYSIVIPVYNGDKYIDDIVSFFMSFNSIQLVFVNDGSTDFSIDKLNKFKEEEWIKVISQNNRGVSVARNLGLHHSDGEFILFLDCDDKYDEKIFDELNKRNLSDVNVFEFERNNIDGTHDSFTLPNVGIINSRNALLLFFFKKIRIHICAVCFRKKFLVDNKIKFKSGFKFGEDLNFIINAILSSEDVLFINESIFKYIINEQSVTQRKFNYHRFDALDVLLMEFNKVELDLGGEGKEAFQMYMLSVYYKLLCECVKSGSEIYFSDFSKRKNIILSTGLKFFIVKHVPVRIEFFLLKGYLKLIKFM